MNFENGYVKPNFVIPGAARSGTTTLVTYLKQHPNIFFSPRNETRYFTNHFSKGQEWYLKLFKEADPNVHQAIGEKSTNYMYNKNVPKRMYKFNSDFKIIFILRDPTKRTFSVYKREIQTRGVLDSFEEWLEKNEDRVIEPGLYHTHIKNYLNYFPRNQMKFIIFKDFINDTTTILRNIFKFLEVKNIEIEKTLKKNPSRMPISIKLQRFIYTRLQYDIYSENIAKVASKVILNKTLNFINHLSYNQEFPELKRSTEKYLRETFRDEINNLEKSIDRDLTSWKRI